MARQFAQFHLRMWIDTEWTGLTVEAQHLYKLLLSQEDIGPSGLIPLRPRRWARLSSNGSVEKVHAALAELDTASFLVVDTETAEVLVRTFIRNGENYKHVRLLQLALHQAERVESPRVRSALGQELALLPAVAVPESNGKNAKAIAEAREAQQHLDAVVSQLNDAPPDPGHGMRSWDDVMGWADPTVPVPVTGLVPVPPMADFGSRSDSSLDGEARMRLELVDARCYEHPGQRRRGCSGCAADAKAGEAS